MQREIKKLLRRFRTKMVYFYETFRHNSWPKFPIKKECNRWSIIEGIYLVQKGSLGIVFPISYIQAMQVKVILKFEGNSTGLTNLEKKIYVGDLLTRKV